MSALVYPELALHEAGATSSILGSVLLLCVAAGLAGRAFLSWFPAGSIGGHGPRELPVTWAASHLVGLAWFLAVREVAPEVAWLWVALGTPALAGAARLVTLPAELVPRHEPVTSAAWPASLVALVAVIGIGAPVLARPESGVLPLAIANTTAALVLLQHGLHLARAAVDWRVLFCLAVAPFLVATNELGDVWTREFLVLPAAAVAAGTVAWLRREDARALALTAVGVALLAMVPTFGVAAAGCVAVVLALGTARRVRLRAAVWFGLAVTIGAVTRLDPPFLDPDASVGPLEGARAFHCLVIPWLLLVTVAIPFWIAVGWRADRRARASWNPSGAPRGREARTLLLAAVVAWIPFATAPPLEYEIASFPIVETWTLLAFVAGLGVSSWAKQDPEAA